MKLCSKPPAVCARLMEIAREAPDDADIWHPLCVLGHFARYGDAAALAAVRERFGRDAARGCHDNGASMVIAQPIEGLLHLAETDPERVAVMCNVFRYPRTPFPLDIAPLIDKARASRDERERYCLLRIIEPFDDDRVRELALELLNRCGPDSDILDLFIENYRPGDGELIMHAVARRQSSGFEKEFDGIHAVAMAISKIFDDEERVDGREPLLWAYEQTPCSLCRKGIVESLIRINAAPDWLLQECPHDCSDRTREYAAMAIAGESIDDEQ